MTDGYINARDYAGLLADKGVIEEHGLILVNDYFLRLRTFDGYVCKKCGIIQAEPHRGHKKYYCVHTTNIIDREQKNKEENVWKEISLWTHRAIDVLPAGKQSLGVKP